MNALELELGNLDTRVLYLKDMAYKLYISKITLNNKLFEHELKEYFQIILNKNV